MSKSKINLRHCGVRFVGSDLSGTKTTNLLIVLILLAQILCAETMYIVNSNSEYLSKYDTETGEVTNNFIDIGQYANQIYIKDDLAYVVNSGEHNIQVIDLQNANTIDYLQCSNGSNPYWMVISPDGLKGYVTGLFTNKVYVFDPATCEISGSIDVGTSPEGIYYFEEKLFVMNTCYGAENGTVSVIDTETEEVVETITVGNNPQYAAFDDQGRLHVVCTGNYGMSSPEYWGKIYLLDTENYSILSTLDIGGSPTRISIHPNGTVYLADGMGQGFMAYDVDNLTIIHPSDNLFATGGAFVIFDSEEKIYLGDALDWTNFGKVHIYSDDENFVIDFTVGVGPTDAAFNSVNSVETDQLENTFSQTYNYPNPFSHSTTIFFNETTNFHVFSQIKIYNIKGQIVRKLKTNEIVWDGKDTNGQKVTSGVYLYKVEFDSDNSCVQKMILLRE